jgi:anti-sigma B factor antagonist
MMPVEPSVLIKERSIGPITVIDVDGRLTADDQPGLLKQTVEGALARGVADIIIDLADVDYVDSTRLGELIAAHLTTSRHGARLILVAVPARVRELLRLADLEHVFKQYASIDAATDRLQEQR